MGVSTGCRRGRSWNDSSFRAVSGGGVPGRAADPRRGTGRVVHPRCGLVAPGPGVVAGDHSAHPAGLHSPGGRRRADARHPGRSRRPDGSGAAGQAARVATGACGGAVLRDGVLAPSTHPGVGSGPGQGPGPGGGPRGAGGAGSGLLRGAAQPGSGAGPLRTGQQGPILAALAEPRRTATLLAITRHLDAVAIDDALDLFALLMATKLINPARRAWAAEGLASLPRLERASRTLAVVNRELFTALDAAATGAAVDVAAVWAAIERVAPRAQIAAH